MNRREAIMAGTAGFAAVLSGAPAASAQTSETENPELQPIRDLLDAHDAAFANHDLDGVMACLSEKATIMGTSPGEIWSGPDEIKRPISTCLRDLTLENRILNTSSALAKSHPTGVG